MRIFLYISIVWASVSQGVSWLAYGNLNGHFESCGCSKETDYGGVARLESLVSRERRKHQQLLVFDLGDQQGGTGLEARYLALALEQIAADAVLVNRREFARLRVGKHLLAGNLPWVLTNSKKNLYQRPGVAVVDKIQLKGAVVFGYLWDDAWKRELHRWSSPAAYQQGKGLRVLLFSGPESELGKIVKSKIFDLIISSNKQRDGVPDFLEKKEPGRLMRPSGVYMTPYAGLGVLRSFGLEPAVDLVQAAFGKVNKVSKLADKSSLLSGTAQRFTWLDGGYSGGLVKLMQSYEKEARLAFQSAGKSSGKFVGAEACKPCHLAAYKAWQDSAHAKAYVTLQKVSKAENPQCVSCHVVGFGHGGFSAKTPHLRGVQCENCHGARADHVKNPTVKPRSSPAGCKSCHHSPHTIDFDFKKSWEKIKHSR